MGLSNLIGKSTPPNTDTLTKDELKHLLFALSESTFRGNDVHLLSSIVNKLTNQLESK